MSDFFKAFLPPVVNEFVAAAQRDLRDGFRRINGEEGAQTELVVLHPGWAVRRRHKHPDGSDLVEVEFFVSGYAYSEYPGNVLTRSQSAFLTLAKGFANLPRLDEDQFVPPSAIDVDTLERRFQDAVSLSTPVASPTSTIVQSGVQTPQSPKPKSYMDQLRAPLTPAELVRIRQQHANIENRLRPLWATVLPGRTVTITVTSPHSAATSPENQSIITTTAEDGFFQARLWIPWKVECEVGEEALVTATLEPLPAPKAPTPTLVELLDRTIQEQLAQARERAEALDRSMQAQLQARNGGDPVPSHQPPKIQLKVPPQREVKAEVRAEPAKPQTINVKVTEDAQVRVVSDVDDTLRDSGVLRGPREVFWNVFVKEFTEAMVPGMAEWYSEMEKKGVRFHYISNAPAELLGTLKGFMKSAGFPFGSIKLRSYAGRSIFNGLLAPTTRKRPGVIQVLETFLDSRFILVGDSGEGDLELYAEVAERYPDRILAVFIRDVDKDVEPIDDPTGSRIIDALESDTGGVAEEDAQQKKRRVLEALLSMSKADAKDVNGAPAAVKTETGDEVVAGLESETGDTTAAAPELDTVDTAAAAPEPETGDATATPASGAMVAELTAVESSSLPASTPSPVGNAGGAAAAPAAAPQLTETEKRRLALQTRVYEARLRVPKQIPLRVFSAPKDCVEMDEILVRGGRV